MTGSRDAPENSNYTVSSNDGSASHSFYEAGWLVYIVGSLGVVFGASQVAPDGWRRVAAGSLLLAAAISAVAAYRFKPIRAILRIVAVAAVVAALPVTLLPSSSGQRAPAEGPAGPIPPSATSPSTHPSSDLTTTASSKHSATPVVPTSPPALPREKPLIAMVKFGRAGEFFSGRLRVGLSSVYSDYSVMNVFTDGRSCKPLFIDLGQSVPFAGGGGWTYVVTLLATTPDRSVEVRLERRLTRQEDTSAGCGP